MFFKSKKEKAQKAETAPVIEKKELLYRENIRTGCAPATKQEAIMAAGKMLVETGYVEPEYAEAMLEREKTCSTFMGNGLALPHGVEAESFTVRDLRTDLQRTDRLGRQSGPHRDRDRRSRRCTSRHSGTDRRSNA